jgi:hypothetical protein
VSDAVVTEGESEAGVNDLAKGGRRFGGPFPEGLSNLGFIVAEFPGGIGAESVAKGGGFLG